MLTFGSLFSGIGGFDLGFERAGMRPAWQVEINERCNQVLARHWPNVQRYGDVRDVGRDGLESVDVICGGFPCQDLSVAGRRAGLAGERSGLWWEFHRIIAELAPRWVVIENVPGLLSSNGGRDMGAIIGALGQLGYGYAWAVLDAQFFGVAQRRRRVFIVGCLGDWTGAPKVLFEPESGERDIAPGRETREKVAGTLAAGAHPSGFNGRDAEGGNIVPHALSGHNQRNDPDGEHFIVAPTLTAPDPNAPHRDGKRQDGSRTDKIPIVFEPESGERDTAPGRESGERAAVNVIKGAAIGRKPEAGPQYGEVRTDGISYTLNSTEVHADGVNLAFSLNAHHSPRYYTRDNKTGGKPSGCADITNAHKAGDSAPMLARIYPTLRGQPNQGPGRMADDSAAAGMVRRLMPIECERLQGFPDSWSAIDGMSDSARYRMLGNAVAVPVAEWIGWRIENLRLEGHF
jgi:DNA (cytosine-5)-methyltransferase 1